MSIFKRKISVNNNNVKLLGTAWYLLPLFRFIRILKILNFRLNDGVTSMSHAVILRVFELVGEKNIELMAYSLTFSNFRLFTFAFGETDKKILK